MRLNKVILFSVISSFVLAIASYFIFSLDVSLGLLLGCIAGCFSMYLLVDKFKNIDLSNYKYIKKSMKSNKMLRYMIYVIAVLIGIVIPSIFHVLAVLVGIIIVKICVYIDAFTNKKM